MRNTKLETYWKRRLFPALLFIFLVAFSSLALAEKAGWETDGTKVWYNTAMEDGKLERAKGLTKIGSRTFYFNEFTFCHFSAPNCHVIYIISCSKAIIYLREKSEYFIPF